MKDYIVSDSPTLMRYSLRIILCLASCYGLTVYSCDVKQAYLQSDTPFQRDVFITVPDGYDEIGKDYVLKIEKPLYGLTESGSYWFNTYAKFFEEEMHMKSFLLDPCLMYRKDRGLLIGITGIILDDTIEAGNLAFIKEEDQKSETFLMNPKQISCFEFSGMRVEQRESTISLEQQDYISGINRPSAIKPDGRVFQTIRRKLSWCVHSTRPDLAYYGAKLAQVKAEKVTVDDMKLLRRAVRVLRKRASADTCENRSQIQCFADT